MKPTIPSGTRDFSPLEVSRRNYIFSVIKERFERYGYQPIETPAMENLSTLLGKYGEEGDKLIFKILNSGDFISTVPDEKIKNPTSRELLIHLSDKALRYDLTVPFARYVVQHQHEINFPFKRYQIQPVWRADRPQKGRYREFFQCDADVIGSKSLMNETELLFLTDDIFSALKMNVFIKVNNRKLIYGFSEILGIAGKFNRFAVVLDKLEKAGYDSVMAGLLELGADPDKLEMLKPYLYCDPEHHAELAKCREIVTDSSIGSKGIDELTTLFRLISDHTLKSPVKFDATLARGLNYYTGTIIEVKSKIGTLASSVCGGGRYDDLTGIFGLPDVSGVGISFGADRIYDIMTEMNLFPGSLASAVQLLFVNFGGEEETASLKILQQVRAEGIHAEIYPDAVKIKKQFEYANKKGVRFVAAIGPDERKNNKITLKNMTTGNQVSVSLEELVEQLTHTIE